MRKPAYKVTRKFIAILVVLALVLTLAPAAVLAEGSPPQGEDDGAQALPPCGHEACDAQVCAVAADGAGAACGHDECAALEQCAQELAQAMPVISAVAPLAADIAAQAIEPGGAPALPAALAGTVDGAEAQIPVIWESSPAFDADAPGTYTYTPTADGYALADGVALPAITVTVAAQPQKAPERQAKLISAVDAPAEAAAGITAAAGTPMGELPLPAGLTGTVDDVQNTAFPVIWGCDAYDADMAGEYTFTASLTDGYALADGVTLPAVKVTLAGVSALAARSYVVTLATEVDGSHAGDTGTLEWALASANANADGGVITFALTAGTTIEIGMTVGISGNVTIDGGANNITLQRGVSDEIFDVSTGASFTLENITIDGYGTNITTDGPLVFNEGTLTLNTGAVLQNNINDTTNGGGIYNENGTVYINGGSITGNEATDGYGGGIFNTAVGSSGVATVAMTAGSISSNTADDGGGGICSYIELGNSGATTRIELTGGTVGGVATGNIVTDGPGGGVLMADMSGDATQSLRIAGGHVDGNTAAWGGGGGVCMINDGVIELAGGSINNNGALSGGGVGMINDGGVFRLESGSVDGNTAISGNGGGIYNENGTVYINGGSVSGNTAATNGGGICIYSTASNTGNATVQMTAGEITGNEAQNGGGIYSVIQSLIANVAVDIRLGGGSVAGNTATGRGGGIYMNNASNRSDATQSLVINGGHVDGNRASSSGGGVCMTGPGTFELESGSINGNTAYNSNGSASGGGIFFTDGTLTMSGGQVSGNTLESAANAVSGGGIYAGSSTLEMRGGEIADNTARGVSNFNNSGGGVYLTSATCTMTGGVITGNAVQGSSALGDGVYISGGNSTLTVSGDAVIGASPADNGVYAEWASGTGTDIRLADVAGNVLNAGARIVIEKDDRLLPTAAPQFIAVQKATAITDQDAAKILYQDVFYDVVHKSGDDTMLVLGVTDTWQKLADNCAGGTADAPLEVNIPAGHPLLDASGAATFSSTVTVPAGTYVHVTVPAGATLYRGDGHTGALFSIAPGSGLGFTNVAFDGRQVQANGPLVAVGGGGMFAAENSTFKNGVNTGGAGALSAAENSDTTLSGCTFSNNTGTDGGAISNSGRLSLTDCAIKGNSAQRGGAVFNAGLTGMTGTELSGNNAASGGGIYNAVPTRPYAAGQAGLGALDIRDGTVISGNTATGTGGGIYNENYGFDPAGGPGRDTYPGLAIGGGVKLTGNGAQNGGAVYNAAGGRMMMWGDGAEISGNTASNLGNGIYVLGEYYVMGTPQFTGSNGLYLANEANPAYVGGKLTGSAAKMQIEGLSYAKNGAVIARGLAAGPFGAYQLAQADADTFSMLAPIEGLALTFDAAGNRVYLKGDDPGPGPIPTPTVVPGAAGVMYTITATASGNGAIEAAGRVETDAGSDRTFYFTPAAGERVVSVRVDGKKVTPAHNTYTFRNVQANHTIHVTFTVGGVAPRTGDDTNINVYIVLLMTAGVCIAGVLIYRRRKARR